MRDRSRQLVLSLILGVGSIATAIIAPAATLAATTDAAGTSAIRAAAPNRIFLDTLDTYALLHPQTRENPHSIRMVYAILIFPEFGEPCGACDGRIPSDGSKAEMPVRPRAGRPDARPGHRAPASGRC
jgi:hypothetical protein